MKKQSKQLILFGLVIVLVFAWYLWPHSLEKRICRDFPAADFSTVERFSVEWTPPNAVRDYEAGAYPQWTLPEEDTQPILDILQKATISGDLPGGQRNATNIGDEGIYHVSAWCFSFSLNQEGVLHLWNKNYRLDQASLEALWAILQASHPETY